MTDEIIEFELPKLIEDLGMMYPNVNSKHKRRYGIYECGFCGTHFKAMTVSINSGNTKSCGCYHKSQASKFSKIAKHGGKGTKLYNIWTGIKARTTNENGKNEKVFDRYGGRGITIYEEWLNDFVAFRDWALENGYEEGKGLSIDRIDNDGNYEPSNCRWTTQTIQCRNQRIPKNNTSGYKGVYSRKNKVKFEVSICINYKRIHLGTFKTAVEGAIAYNNYIIENNLEGFILNVIPEQIKEKENT